MRGRFIRPDGTIVSVVDLDGQLRDATFHIYDQAFEPLGRRPGIAEFRDSSGYWRDALALRDALASLGH